MGDHDDRRIERKPATACRTGAQGLRRDRKKRGMKRLRPGGATTANLQLTKAGKRQIAKLDKVKVKVNPTRGKATTRTVTVQR